MGFTQIMIVTCDPESGYKDGHALGNVTFVLSPIEKVTSDVDKQKANDIFTTVDNMIYNARQRGDGGDISSQDNKEYRYSVSYHMENTAEPIDFDTEILAHDKHHRHDDGTYDYYAGRKVKLAYSDGSSMTVDGMIIGDSPDGQSVELGIDSEIILTVTLEYADGTTYVLNPGDSGYTTALGVFASDIQRIAKEVLAKT
jgi:hypothetical protein